MSGKQIVSHTILYYLSTVINQAVPFLILPVMAVYLSPEDFGYINTFSAIVLIAASIFGGFYNVINKFFFKESDEYKTKLLGTLYLLLFLMVSILFLVSIGYVRFQSNPVLPGLYIMLIPLAVFGQVSLELQKTVLRISKKVWAFTLLTFSDVVLNVSISLVLIIAFTWHWHGRVVAMMASAVFLGGLVLIQNLRQKKVSIKYRKELIQESLKLALPLIPAGFCVMLIRRSGVLFVDSYYGKSEAGLLGVAMNLATVILFLAVPVINVWIPYVHEKLSNPKEQGAISALGQLFNGLLFSGLVVTILFSLCSKLILKLMTTEAYHGAAAYIPWLAFGFFFWVIAAWLTPLLVHYGRQLVIALANIIGAITSVLLTLLLIQKMGPMAAVYAFLIANFITVLLMGLMARRHVAWSLIPDLGFMYRSMKHAFRRTGQV